MFLKSLKEYARKLQRLSIKPCNCFYYLLITPKQCSLSICICLVFFLSPPPNVAPEGQEGVNISEIDYKRVLTHEVAFLSVTLGENSIVSFISLHLHPAFPLRAQGLQ